MHPTNEVYKKADSSAYGELYQLSMNCISKIYSSTIEIKQQSPVKTNAITNFHIAFIISIMAIFIGISQLAVNCPLFN